MVDRGEITALILAGGQSSRFQPAVSGGVHQPAVDKGLVQWRGGPLVAHVRQYLNNRVDPVWISANRNLHDYQCYGRVLKDDAIYGQYAGPLAGVATALRQITTPWLLTLPTDTPCLPESLIERLSEKVGAGVWLASAVTPAGAFPLCMLVHRSLFGSLHDALIAGERKVQAWQALAGGVQVWFDAQGAEFFNVNTPQDLETLSAAFVAP